MSSLLIYLPPIPIFFQHLIILLVLIKIPSCLASYNGYSSCAKLISCGKINIGFPFWGEDRPKECGHPLMHLSCDNEISHITINDVAYQVLEANPNSHTLTITREDYLLDLCQPKHVNTSLDTELYVVESPYRNLTLFYGCTPPSSLSLTRIPCNETSVEYASSLFVSFLTLPQSCNTSVVVPVPQSLTEINDFIKVHQAIIGGFVVRWIVGIKECGECEKLNGVCGIDGSSLQTTCYCKDGPCSNFSPNPKESPGTYH